MARREGGRAPRPVGRRAPLEMHLHRATVARSRCYRTGGTRRGRASLDAPRGAAGKIAHA